jgi:hypothetical protein
MVRHAAGARVPAVLAEAGRVRGGPYITGTVGEPDAERTIRSGYRLFGDRHGGIPGEDQSLLLQHRDHGDRHLARRQHLDHENLGRVAQQLPGSFGGTYVTDAWMNTGGDTSHMVPHC